MTSRVSTRTTSPAPIGWGILGTGFIAHAQTADLVGCGFTVAAVGSRSLDTAKDFAVEFGIPTAHGSYEALVADPDVDAIYVSTPHPFHAENALLALHAGKHVLIEKAFTLNAAEAREVVETAEAAGLVVMEAMWTRFLPHMARIREIIAAGTLGELRTLIADHNQDLPTDPQHRINNLALGGGALLDLGIYPVSFAFDRQSAAPPRKAALRSHRWTLHGPDGFGQSLERVATWRGCDDDDVVGVVPGAAVEVAAEGEQRVQGSGDSSEKTASSSATVWCAIDG